MSEFWIDLGDVLDEKASLKKHDAGGRKPFRLTERQLSTHVAVLGPTGAGKSRLIWQMLREHRRQRRGFCCIDPGDLACDFLADCAAEVLLEGNYALLKRLLWFKLNPFRTIRYDPWKCVLPEGIQHDFVRGATACWRHNRVQQFMQVLQANVTGGTDFMNQPRAQRVLTNVFTALSTAVAGRHLAIEDVFIFFDPSHKAWRKVLDRCVPHLPREVKQELEQLGGLARNLRDLRLETESSINRIRSLLGQCMRAMLSATGTEPSFDWYEAVQNGSYVIVDCQQTMFASHAENVALASLMALDLGETVLNTPRHKRKPFTLFVDEAAEFLGPLGKEFGRWLRIMRKYGMPCVLAFQDLASMQVGELDLAPPILGQCGTILCFRSRWHQDNDVLARILLTGNLQFVPLVQDVYQNRGEHEWLRMQEVSKTVNHTDNRGSTHATMNATANTHTLTNAKSQHASQAQAGAESRAYGPTGLLASVNKGANVSSGNVQGDSSAVADGVSNTASTTDSETAGSADGWAVSVGEKLMPLPIVVHDVQKTGSLERSVTDQHEQNRQHLHGLDDRHMIVLAPGMKKAVEVRTLEVSDPFQSPEDQAKAVKWIEGKICEKHEDIYFTPSFDPEDQDARVQAYLGEDNPDAVEAEEKAARKAARRVSGKAAERNSRGEKPENPLD